MWDCCLRMRCAHAVQCANKSVFESEINTTDIVIVRFVELLLHLTRKYECKFNRRTKSIKKTDKYVVSIALRSEISNNDIIQLQVAKYKKNLIGVSLCIMMIRCQSARTLSCYCWSQKEGFYWDFNRIYQKSVSIKSWIVARKKRKRNRWKTTQTKTAIVI